MSTTEAAHAILERAKEQFIAAWQQLFLAQGAKLSAAFPKRKVSIWASHGYVTFEIDRFKLGDPSIEDWPKYVDDRGTRQFMTELDNADSELSHLGTIIEGTQAEFLNGQQVAGNVQFKVEPTPQSELDEYIAARITSYRAERIPTRPDGTEFEGVHWQIWLNEKFTTYYSVGIGHYIKPGVGPKGSRDRSIISSLKTLILNGKPDEVRLSKAHLQNYQSAEIRPLLGSSLKLKKHTGFRYSGDFDRTFEFVPPTVNDILQSLAGDADALEYTFPDWAAEFGYSDDSIKARRIYETCQIIGHQLKGLHIEPSHLRNLFSEAGY